MLQEKDDIFSIRDIIDSQLVTSDERRIGRVADIEGEWRNDGSVVLTSLMCGPQALARRTAKPFLTIARFLFRNRFEHTIPISDVTHFGPTLQLRNAATDYKVGQSERWIAKYILRWIPGSGH